MKPKFPAVMENFDIEKLERKNIYSKHDFFAEMQQNVLQKTVHSIPYVKSEDSKPSKSWLYAVAAAVVLLFGISLFWVTSKSETQPKIEVAKNNTTKVENTQIIEQLAVNNDLAQQTVHENAATTQEIIAPKPVLKENINIPASKKFDNVIKDPIYVSNKDLAQNDVDKIVNELPANDLAELNNEADADVYLDLYN